MRIIGITGFRGSGKSLAASAARELKLPLLEMRTPVVALMRKRGMKVTNRSLRLFANQLREKMGMAASAKLAVAKIKSMKAWKLKKAIVVNGVRSPAEIQEFRRHFKFKLIAITAPIRMRFRRILRRGRRDDPKRFKDFLWSERMELKWGLAKAVSSANHSVSNTRSKDESVEKLKAFLRTLAR